jgi:hypothetical protein
MFHVKSCPRGFVGVSRETLRANGEMALVFHVKR